MEGKHAVYPMDQLVPCWNRVIQGVSQSILDMYKFTESHPDFELPMNNFRKVFQDGMGSLTNRS